jgi:hypothetical protein
MLEIQINECKDRISRSQFKPAVFDFLQNIHDFRDGNDERINELKLIIEATKMNVDAIEVRLNQPPPKKKKRSKDDDSLEGSNSKRKKRSRDASSPKDRMAELR